MAQDGNEVEVWSIGYGVEETREGPENQTGGVWGKVEVIILRGGGE
jgi:hypothetical protein